MKGQGMSLFKLGKVKLSHKKITAGQPAVRLSPPESVTLPMQQHIGAPAKVCVAVGDEVFVGTLVGEAQGFVSSPVYSSVSGKVKSITTYLASNGNNVPAVVIESDGKMTPDPQLKPPEVSDFASLSAAVAKSGLVGLGGAGFPTAVKLDKNKISSIDTLVINGAECEPYITSDTNTMLNMTGYLCKGIEAILKYSGIKRAIVGIEKNKPECISLLTDVFASDERVQIAPLPEAYPQGAEKILIYNTTGRVVKKGALPADAGVLLMNVTSVAFVAQYLENGMPLVEKCITVDGSAVAAPKNVIAPIGMSIGAVIEAAGGLAEEAGKILYGGPMMGIAVYSDKEPVLKNTNAITVLNKKDAQPKKQFPCIHCGRCVSACPMGLNPTVFAKSMNLENAEERVERLTKASISLCIECGCCSYVCPSARPLVEFNRLAKGELRAAAARAKSQEKKEEKK